MAGRDSFRTTHELADERYACANSSLQPVAKQQFKIKRKSDTTYKRKKRKCSYSSNQCSDTNSENAGPCIESLGIMQSSTPKGKSSHKFNDSMQSNSYGGIPPEEKRQCQVSLMCHDKNDSMSDFWNDDKLFADLSLNQDSSLKAKCMTMTEETFYGMPLQLKQMLLQSRGINELYEWQKACLCLSSIKERKNLIYSLPTSGGKTLVSEILMMRELLLNKKDVMFVLPFVSIVQEKVQSLAHLAVELDFVIEEYAGNKGRFPPCKRRKKRTLYIATIEKANGLVNSFIEETRIGDIGLVVVDELHMLGEGGRRGATLEMCLTKLLCAASQAQIIGMSATLSNIKELQQFLRAEVYANDFRPVTLHEYVKIGKSVYYVNNNESGLSTHPVRHITDKVNNARKVKDPDNLVLLVTEVIPEHSCLVFCSTKRNCENVAKLLVDFLPKSLCEIRREERKCLLQALFNQANGVCPVLKRTIPFGIAYHHSGLTVDERKLIEYSYSKGVLCVLTCTSTLAAGVNLPAKRVILRAPYIGKHIISRSQYKQMIGRAGRAGIDTSGESILIIKESDKAKVRNLFSGPYDSCKSSLLYQDGKGVRILVLSLLGLKLCFTQTQLISAINDTLLAIQTEDKSFAQECTMNAIKDLVALGLVKGISRKSGDVNIDVTKLGHASYKGCLDVDNTQLIYQNIEMALECLVLVNELHLLYLATPIDLTIPSDLDWMVYQKQVALFNDKEKKVVSTIGISELYLLGKAYGQKLEKVISEDSIRRFYMTLMLYHLVQGASIWNVADLFKVSRGFVQNLLTSATSFVICLIHFTKELSEFWAINILLENIMKRLSCTVNLELAPLMEIPGVKQARARQLFKAGYRSMGDIARSNPDKLVKEIEHLYKKQAREIVSAAKMLLKEKADTLLEEAQDLISYDQQLSTPVV
ncbi:helicase POLQ-like isoform X2 [Actinia tenebrosa]|uniref:Helicase POLQ-like isoform X2 n=1 Tax=Actinia tenebrosa TaxID=6105 RepID=A0A6P8HT64_ACTTE|nr:helicase POLQ-like isoform X2 [Actinia tenebrosa]